MSIGAEVAVKHIKFVMGACNPMQHSWHAHPIQLERFFPGNATKAVIQKVVGGAATAPLVLSANFALVGALKGHDRDRIADKVKRDVGPTWLAGTMCEGLDLVAPFTSPSAKGIILFSPIYEPA